MRNEGTQKIEIPSADRVVQIQSRFWADFDASASKGSFVSSDDSKKTYSPEAIAQMRKNMEREMDGIIASNTEERKVWLNMLRSTDINKSDQTPATVRAVLNYATSSDGLRERYRMALIEILSTLEEKE